MNQVGVHSGERGDFYILSISLPQDLAGKRLDSVFLDFAVDATSLSEEDTIAAEVGVFPLTQNYVAGGQGGDGPGMNAAPVFTTLVPSMRPIPAGDSRRLRMDITDIVRGWIANPATNHGLVIGALTGPEVATVTLNNEIPGGTSPVVITFFYQNRFGNRLSESE